MLLQETLQETLQRNAGCLGQCLVRYLCTCQQARLPLCAECGLFVLRPVPHHPLQVRWRDAAEDASPDSPNGSDAGSATALEQQGSVPNTGGSEN
jgi:hypothetical protein